MNGKSLPVVEVGPVAHGGSCVARLDGQVVFVRHSLPGERVRIRVTDTTKRFLRADAVEVLEASPDRVEPPCALAGTCGGCDFQHVEPAAQRRLLADVVAEQLRRLAGIERDVVVEEVRPTLGWRTRVTWSTTPDGRPGLRKHRSHEVVPVDHCPIAHPDLPDVTAHRWDSGPVEAIVSSTGQRLVVTDATVPSDLDVDGVAGTDGHRRAGGTRLTEHVAPHDFTVTGSGFWQVHPGLISHIADTVLAWGAPESGERWWDLYAGVGPLAAALADRVGPSGHVVAVESSPIAADEARRVLEIAYGRDVVAVQQHDVRRWIHRAREQGAAPDGVVLDPPRTGAGKSVIEALGSIRPGRVVVVACDPVALGRDIQLLAGQGYRLAGIRAWDAFPQTHPLESIAHFLPDQIS